MKKRIDINRNSPLTLAIAVFAISLVIIAGVEWFTSTSVESDQYLSLATLGSDGLAEHYYPGTNPIVNPGEPLHWVIQVYNHMGSIELVSVRFKISNSTIPSPSDINSTPSPSPILVQFNKLLNTNETWSFDLPWQILTANSSQNYVVIHSIIVNGTLVSGLSAEALQGYNFRVILELWVFDPALNQYAFSWNSAGQTSTTWNQIWFNVTSPR
jgi:hypothetical protein